MTTPGEDPKGPEKQLWMTNNIVRFGGFLNATLSVLLQNGVIQHDRSAVSRDYPWVPIGNTVIISAPTLKEVADEGVRILSSGDGKLRGTCREIAPALAEWLKSRIVPAVANFAGVGSAIKMKHAMVLGCTNDGEFHYCTVGDIEDVKNNGYARILLDLGYSQPVPQAVVVDRGPHESSFYDGERLDGGQIYGGKVLYEAVSEGDGIVFTIKNAADGKLIKRFEFKTVEQVDKEIIKGFPAVTGRNFKTEVVIPDPDRGEHRVNRIDRPDTGELGSLHRILRTANETGQKINLVVEYR
jgi:hypothetical protein